MLFEQSTNECYKTKRDPKDIHIAAILYPNVTGSNYIDKEDKDGNHKHRQL